MPIHAALRSTVVAATLLFAADLSAQTLFGAASAGAGGISPRIWFTGSASPGTSYCSFDLERAVGAAPAFLLVGFTRSGIAAGGIVVHVQPVATLFVGFAAGIPGVPGAGALSQGLGIPNSAAFLGLPLEAQWVVADAGVPNGLAATGGLELVVGQPPLVLAAGKDGLSPHVYAIDPATGGVVDWSGSLGVGDPRDVLFSEAGNLCLVASGASHQFVVGDAANGGANLASVTTVGGLQPNAIAVTPDGGRAYGITSAGNTSRIVEIDLVRTSPNFGTQVAAVTGLPLLNQFEGVAISGDGRVLCACNLGLGQASALVFVDIDPSSPTYNTATHTIYLPTMATDVQLDETGELAYVLQAPLIGPGGLLVVSRTLGFPLTAVSNVGVFPTDLAISPRRDCVLAACPNSSNVVRIDIDSGSPTFLAVTSLALADAPFSVAFAPDGRTAWCNANTGTNVTEFATGTMTMMRILPVGAGGNAAICVR